MTFPDEYYLGSIYYIKFSNLSNTLINYYITNCPSLVGNQPTCSFSPILSEPRFGSQTDQSPWYDHTGPWRLHWHVSDPTNLVPGEDHPHASWLVTSCLYHGRWYKEFTVRNPLLFKIPVLVYCLH